MGTEAQYRADLQAFLTQRVIPQVAQWEREQTFPHAIVHELGQQGFFRTCLHSTDLKQPLQMRMFRILIEELAKTYCFGLTLTISMHVGVFLPLIIHLAHPQLRATLIEQALDGDILGTMAITEDIAAGSDFMGMASTVCYEDDTLVLQGQKHYITNAAVADYVVTFARWRDGRHFANFSAILVPTAHPHVQRAPIPMAIMKTAVISHIDFEQVRLPAHYLLGRDEYTWLQQLERTQQAPAFYRIWTIKEACVKALGYGLQFPLREIRTVPETTGQCLDLWWQALDLWSETRCAIAVRRKGDVPFIRPRIAPVVYLNHEWLSSMEGHQ
jgi:alkylation response protein AidB-like acyl-CoA dehydrogenase